MVLVAQDSVDPDPKKASLEDKDSLDFAQAWAKQMYGCTGTTCVRAFRSYGDLKTKLKGLQKTIGKLAILCHSSPGALDVPFQYPGHATGIQVVSLAQIVADMGPDLPEVDEVDFLGCNMGRDPVAMWDFGIALKAGWVAAHTFFHAFHPIDLKIGSGEDPSSLEKQLDVNFPYLLPKTEDLLKKAAATAPTTVQLWVEWFREDNSKTQPAEVNNLERKHFKLRSAAEEKQRFDKTDAAELKQLYSVVRGVPFHWVRLGLP